MTESVQRSDCDLEALAAWVDGRLDAAARAGVLAHVASCPACAEVVADVVATLGELEDGASNPAALAPAAATPHPGGRRRLLPRAWVAGIAATAAVALGLAAWWAGRVVSSPAEAIVAALGEPVAALGEDPWGATAGLGFGGADPSLDRPVTAGALLVDLAVARRSGRPVVPVCARLEAIVGPVACATTSRVAAVERRVRERLATAGTDAGMVGRRLELGSWLEGARLAAGAGRAEFFARQGVPGEVAAAAERNRDAAGLVECVAGGPRAEDLAAIADYAAHLLAAPP